METQEGGGPASPKGGPLVAHLPRPVDVDRVSCTADNSSPLEPSAVQDVQDTWAPPLLGDRDQPGLGWVLQLGLPTRALCLSRCSRHLGTPAPWRS